MAAEFIKALENEMAALEAELQRDPRFAKLTELRRVKAVYSAPSGAVHQADGGAVNPPARKRTGSPERAAILKKAKGILAGRTTPTPTIDIFDEISLEIEIPGTVPKNNLSAMLSNSKDFQSHGRSGWTLTETKLTSGDEGKANAPEVNLSSTGLTTGGTQHVARYRERPASLYAPSSRNGEVGHEVG